MSAISPSPASTPQTRAFLAFEQTLDIIGHMVYMGGREIRFVQGEAKRLTKLRRRLGDLKAKDDVAKYIRSVQRFANTAEVRIARYGTANLWQVVMLVTAIEGYFERLLSSAASVDPEFMRESRQCAPYSDIVAASSLEELANELRIRWARGWLSDGGPTRWISRLERMGARGYPAGLAPRLELIWGIRHAVVHAAGIASADFVKRHPGVVSASGHRLRLNSRDFGRFLDAVQGFLRPTENFFLARYPSLRAEACSELAK